MTFIITLIAFVIERFFDWSHIRQWQWFTRYQTLISLRLSVLPSYVVLLICLLPLLFIVGVINSLLTGVLLGLFKIIFGVLILAYCTGPNNFWAQVYACIQVLNGKDSHAAMEFVQTSFGVTVTTDPQRFHRAFTNALFVEAHKRIFATFFWFILLGPVGAVLYRAVDFSKLRGVTTQQAAAQMQRVLDWPSARLFTFIFALGGHFKGVIKQWKQDFIAPMNANDNIITECGIAAVDVLEMERIPEDGTAESETLSLLDRVFIMSLVILAIIVLIR